MFFAGGAIFDVYMPCWANDLAVETLWKVEGV